MFCFGTPAEAVPERLALYEKCRKERASKIQEASRIFSQSQDYQKKKGFDRQSALFFFFFFCPFFAFFFSSSSSLSLSLFFL